IVKEHIKPQLMTVGKDTEEMRSAEVLMLPRGMRAHSVKAFLDEYRTAPERRKGTAKLQDLASFIAHAKRFKNTDSALFANPDPKAPSLTSVIDYHHSGPKDYARYGEHRGLYCFPLSDEWKAWTSLAGVGMSQEVFAAWVEDHITDVADPRAAGETAKALAQTIGAEFASQARLLELSRGLSIRVGQRLKTKVNLDSGECSLQFESEHQDETGAPLKIPGAFLLALPVFKTGAAYTVAVRLRYRTSGASVTWYVDLYRADRIFDHAFNEACEQAQTETELPLFVGAPE
ncbi:MAG: uncharacterized protein JWM74_1094, partial [Myxococcaceae bacterium]|nr:uncharacterized protein [Myxococcaceae bacterium]